MKKRNTNRQSLVRCISIVLLLVLMLSMVSCKPSNEGTQTAESTTAPDPVGQSLFGAHCMPFEIADEFGNRAVYEGGTFTEDTLSMEEPRVTVGRGAPYPADVTMTLRGSGSFTVTNHASADEECFFSVSNPNYAAGVNGSGIDTVFLSENRSVITGENIKVTYTDMFGSRDVLITCTAKEQIEVSATDDTLTLTGIEGEYRVQLIGKDIDYTEMSVDGKATVDLTKNKP